MNVFHGSMVALVSPMMSDGQLDLKAFARLIEWHIEQGTDGFVIGGSTGEAASLSLEEKLRLTTCAVQQVKGRIPVVAGNNMIETQLGISLSQEFVRAGVDAILLTVPAYVRPTQEGLYQHFKALAAAVAIPHILYNVPSRTACDLLPQTLERLAGIDNIIGIKEATGSLNRLLAIQACCPQDFMLYSGDDVTAKDFMVLGGHGVISITANLAPRPMHELYEASCRRQTVLATSINDKLAPLHQAMLLDSNPTAVKWALGQLAWINAGIRLPLCPLSTQRHTIVRDAMQHANLTKMKVSDHAV